MTSIVRISLSSKKIWTGILVTVIQRNKEVLFNGNNISMMVLYLLVVFRKWGSFSDKCIYLLANIYTNFSCLLGKYDMFK